MPSRRLSLAKASHYAAMLLSPTTSPPALSSRPSTLLFLATDFIQSMQPATRATLPLRFSYTGSPPSAAAGRLTSNGGAANSAANDDLNAYRTQCCVEVRCWHVGKGK